MNGKTTLAWIAIVVVTNLFSFGIGSVGHSTPSPEVVAQVATPEPSTPPPSPIVAQQVAPAPPYPPRDSPEWSERNQAAKACIISNYPDVAVKGSPLNTAFIAEYRRCMNTTRDFSFANDPEFPFTIIDNLRQSHPELVPFRIPGLTASSTSATVQASAPQKPAEQPAQPPAPVQQQQVANNAVQAAPTLNQYQSIFGANSKMQGSMLDQRPDDNQQSVPGVHQRFYDKEIEARYEQICQQLMADGKDASNEAVMAILQPEIDAKERTASAQEHEDQVSSDINNLNAQESELEGQQRADEAQQAQQKQEQDMENWQQQNPP